MQPGPALIDGSPERRAGRHTASGSGQGSHADIRLTLPADAENVVLVRHVVVALAEVLGLPRPLVEDIKLAVTEACTNVVRHAYADARGSIEVAVLPDPGTLTVIVSDHGRGLRPSVAAARRGDGGLGLPLIAALAHSLEIDQAPDRGSRVRMSFRRAG